ncbi:hypothetical protein O181_028613 [Austropuccinia psidii MF-1]|uniref:Disintegrin and metalloproteinase domain-containing protein B n=1 Tax=Austropuccinia psidii MF-1 TaxID=1389203 RepID=A0A9Q3CRX0_9BASI|nr:hypothetical protein [Austropuccinia psidii MF-1]
MKFILKSILILYLHLKILIATSIRSNHSEISNVRFISTCSIKILPRFNSTSFDLTSFDSISIQDLNNLDSILISFGVSDPSISSPNQIHFNSNPSSLDWFTLSLRPNHNLFHPSAKIITSSSSNSSLSIQTSNLISSNSIFAYSGWTIDHHHSQTWWNEEIHSIHQRSPDWKSSHLDSRVLGWARILINQFNQMKSNNHLNHFIFQGSFESNGQLFHIKPLDSFLKLKSDHDPILIPQSDHLSGGLIIYQDSNSNSNSNLHHPSVTCSHDQLSFNSFQENSIYRTPLQPISLNHFNLFSPTSFSIKFNLLFKNLLGLPNHPIDSPSNLIFNLSIPSNSSPSLKPFLHKRQLITDDISWVGNSSALSNFANTIGSTLGCPIGSRVLFIGVAADCTYVSKHGSQDQARIAILNAVNSASAIFQRTFNISIGIIELNVQSPDCPSSPSSDIPWNVGCPQSASQGLDLNTRLSVFSQWRGQKGGSDGAGLWHLMTNCPTGNEVGVAWLGQLCQVTTKTSSRGQITSGTSVTASTLNEWQVMAHEIGHSFGAIHDCAQGCGLSDSCCPLDTERCNSNGDFIMSPVATKNTSTFSPCSIGNICTTLRSSINTTCLVTPGQRSVISLQQCGNGIVEPGEDCDPGQGTLSNCCNPQTCKFRSGAVCDPANGPCCRSNCQFAGSETVCRPAVNQECDKEERCLGNNVHCPSDQFEDNGKSCGASGAGLTCTSGMCTSRDEQCKAQGTALKLTQSCPPSATMDCQVSCVDPTGRADCLLLTTNFIDGTECGYGGRCHQGACQAGNFKETAMSWFKSNLAISIPIVIAAALFGLIILLTLFRLIKRCMQKPSTPNNQIYPHPSNNHSGLTPLPDSHPHASRTQQEWVDPTAWNGPARYDQIR